mgnify:CR=1 FL=1
MRWIPLHTSSFRSTCLSKCPQNTLRTWGYRPCTTTRIWRWHEESHNRSPGVGYDGMRSQAASLTHNRILRTFLQYSLSTSLSGTVPSVRKIDKFLVAPRAAMTDDTPVSWRHRSKSECVHTSPLSMVGIDRPDATMLVTSSQCAGSRGRSSRLRAWIARALTPVLSTILAKSIEPCIVGCSLILAVTGTGRLRTRVVRICVGHSHTSGQFV